MNKDEIEKHGGGFGWYQIRITLLLCIPTFLTGMHTASSMFSEYAPEFVCEDQPLICHREISENISSCMNKVFDETNFCNCKRFVNATDDFRDRISSFISNDCEIDVKHEILSQKTKNCQNISYDTTVMTSSTVTKFSLVCGKAWQKYLSRSAYMIGVFFNGIVYGDISDRFGRKRAFFIGTIGSLISGIAVAYSPSFLLYCILRMFVGINVFFYTYQFVLVTEISPPNYRAIPGQMLNAAFALGVATLAPYAYFIREFENYQLYMSIALVINFAIWWCLDESPRWLKACGRSSEAEVIYKKMKSTNEAVKILHRLTKQPTSPNKENETMIDVEENFEVETKSKEGILSLLKTKMLRKFTLLTSFGWFSISCVYYGLLLNAGEIGGNIYVNVVLASIVGVIATFMSVIFVTYWGRRAILSTGYLITGTICIVMFFIPSDMNWLLVTLFIFGKFFAEITFDVLFVYAAEVYPTVCRAVGTGTGSAISRIGSAVSPFIAMLAVVSKSLPYVVFGAMSLLCCAIFLLLPETNKQKLCDTVNEAEDFIKLQDNGVFHKDTKQRHGSVKV